MVTFERRLHPAEQLRDDRADIRSLRRVENGEAGVITAVDTERERLTVQLRDRAITVEKEQLDALRLGYAQHVYSAQGRTVDRAFVLVGGWQTDRENSYVGVSRARESTVVITDFSSLGVENRDRDGALQELGDRFGQSRGKVAATALVDQVRAEQERPAATRSVGPPQVQRTAMPEGPQRYRTGEQMEPVDAVRALARQAEERARRAAADTQRRAVRSKNHDMDLDDQRRHQQQRDLHRGISRDRD